LALGLGLAGSASVSEYARAQTVTAPAIAAGCVQNVALGQFACGSGSQATGGGVTDATAVGLSATATGIGSAAFGQRASANADRSTAIGSFANFAFGPGTDSVAVGSFSNAAAAQSVAIGRHSL